MMVSFLATHRVAFHYCFLATQYSDRIQGISHALVVLYSFFPSRHIRFFTPIESRGPVTPGVARAILIAVWPPCSSSAVAVQCVRLPIIVPITLRPAKVLTRGLLMVVFTVWPIHPAVLSRRLEQRPLPRCPAAHASSRLTRRRHIKRDLYNPVLEVLDSMVCLRSVPGTEILKSQPY
jgi:hypothetical protein